MLATTHPLWSVYVGMKQRCSYPKHYGWKYYGARGIKVCEEWNSFWKFVADMFPSWEPGLELERKENNKGYCKDNCCWVPQEFNKRNRRNVIRVETTKGLMTLKEASRLYGIPYETLRSRYHCQGLRGINLFI